uniref:Solute carrier organic anion transporter family member n=1 Tax=Cyprinodon variegatus TaxID=28743 RepID=A0A3Q2DN68_CYPVA
MSVESKKTCEGCCSKLKLFLVSLAFMYFSKAFGGGYMKSSITQIERRFDIPSSLIGVIDGSFEMGNLLVIAFVSYFGAKLHRPRLIGIGCLIMATGSFIVALPHFLQGPYKYETSMSHNTQVNGSENLLPCLSNHSLKTDSFLSACEKAAGSSMWIYVFLGNMLRGIGETPSMPLGISYLDDFSRQENTPFYLACIYTTGMLGPMAGFMLGSYLAKTYVDIGFVDLDSITITYKDSRWVGAWWLGFIANGALILLASIPFFFLPKSLPKQGEEDSSNKSTELTSWPEQENFLPDENQNAEDKEKRVTFKEMVKDFIPSLKRLFRNTIFSMIILTNLVAVNAFVGMITFIPKFMEQIYGQAASRANFIIGTSCQPIVTQVSNNPSSLLHWDPVCAYNGMTYASPCLAGCQTSTGTGKAMVFHNCTCIGISVTPAANMSAVLGQCHRRSECDSKFKIYMALSVLGAFISACGGTPGYIVLLRSIQPDLKSLALGMQTLIVRTLGGIPPPIYFGALIDQACLKWGTKQCGGRGACRLYNANMFRLTFLGLVIGLSILANMLWGVLYVKIVKKQKKLALRDQAKENGAEGKRLSNGHAHINIVKHREETNNESTI